jgi:hypothetical protein
MRYDDASQDDTTASDNAPVARADVAALPPGSFGPENGNVITGAGTISGANGADNQGDGPAKVVEVHGAGGQTTGADGNFQAIGQYGVLNMDGQGNFSYVRNAGTPDGVQDAFGYTIADQDGQTSSATLAMNVGPAAQTAAVTIPGVVNLPPGVELSDITVNGRDLVIHMPDGSQMVIPGGAVFVPQLVIGDVQVPPSNLAALLIEAEPQPAAGGLQSSGGNFATDVPPLDPGVPLGDLIPPTELNFTPPDFEEVGQFVDTEPTVDIQPDDQPATTVASDEVFEAGLGTRPGEPEGSGEEAAPGDNGDPREATAGVIHFTAEDGLESITINGEEITADSVNDTITGAWGTLTITSVDLVNGQIGYTYAITDNNLQGVDVVDHFQVAVTDSDGDVATATLDVTVHDDTPDARNDTDSLTEQQNGTDGNVISGVGTDSGTAGRDTVGADNATVTGVHPGSGTAAFTGVDTVVHGTFGDLTIHANGSYEYVRTSVHDGGEDVFTYQLTDGDGDIDTATLTITVPQRNAAPEIRGDEVTVSEEGLPGGNPDDVGNPTDDTNDAADPTGHVTVSDIDGDSLTVTLGVPDPDPNLTSGGETVHWELSPDGHTLIGFTGSDSSDTDNQVITIVIQDDGDFTTTLLGPIDHPDDDGEQVEQIDIPVHVDDGNGGTNSATIVVNIEDDSPTIDPEADAEASVVVDESGPTSAATIGLGAHSAGDDGDVTGTGPIGTAVSSVGNVAAALVAAGVSYGGDGPGSTTFSLQITNDGSSGVETTEGVAINLVQLNDSTILGIVDGTDTVAFAMSIDGDGNVTLEQYLSLNHPDANDPNDALQLAEGSIGVVVTAIDADGDPVTNDGGEGNEAPVDITSLITFLDDGPTNVTGEINEEFSVVVDESGPGAAAVIAINSGGTTFVAGNDPDVGGAGPIAVGASSVGAVVGSADFGADGEQGEDGLTYALSILSDGGATNLQTTEGVDIDLVQLDNGNVLGIVHGTNIVAFAISIDGDSGEVAIEQYLSILHPDSSDPDDAVSFDDGILGVTVTATDGDGDHITSDAVDIGEHVTFEDDGPTNPDGDVNPEFQVVTDESGPGAAAIIAINSGGTSFVAGNDPDVANSGPIAIGTSLGAGAIVNPSALFGADGEGDPDFTFGLSILALDGDSGLTTTDGTAINLVQLDNGNVLGIVDGSSTVAFAISIDPESGEVRVEQYLSLNHPDASDPDDAISFDDGVLGVTVTATDGDGDQVTSDAVDIGTHVTFEDDGPTDVSGTLNPDFDVVTDESGPGAAAVIAINSGGTTFVAGNDPDVANSGPIAIGTSGGEGAIVDPEAAFGADGPAATDSFQYALSILAGDGDSGLTTTDGTAINLVQLDNGNVLGIVDGSSTVAFAIAIDPDSGEVRVEQYLSLNHPDATDPDDAISFDEGILGVTITATDGDGDQVTSDAVDIGEHVTFEDDGPTAGTPSGTPPTITLDESPVPTDGDGIVSAHANFATLFGTALAGADGAAGDPGYTLLLTPDSEGGSVGSGLFALDATDTDPGTEMGSDGDGFGQGDEIMLVQVDEHTIEGRIGATTYFTISVDADGEVTFSQQQNIWHGDPSNPDDAETLITNGGTLELVQTVTDGDGDTDTASVDISGAFVIEDDGPTAADPEDAPLTNDASGFFSGTLDTGDSTLTDNFGTDGGFARFTEDGLPTGLTSGSVPLAYVISNDGQTLTATAGDGGPTVFVATISGSGYTIDMSQPLDAFEHIELTPLSSGFIGGNDPWAGFNLTGAQDILLTPTSVSGVLGSGGNTLNTSNILLGVGGGQQVDVSEGVRMDFVNNIGGNPSKTDNDGYSDPDNRDHTFDDHWVTNGASIRLTQESGTNVTAQFRAYDDYNGTGVGDPNFSGTDGNDVVGDGTQEVISGITITYFGVGSNLIIPTSTPTDYVVNGHTFTVSLAADGKSVNIVGIDGDNGSSGAGTEVAVFTDDGYTSLTVLNVSTDPSASFKIGSFGLSVVSEDPVEFDLPVQIVDTDGDVSDTANIHVIASPPDEALLLASTSSSLESSFDTSSLFANDNQTNQKLFHNGSNAVLMGALAAAGLESAPAAASTADAQDTNVLDSSATTSVYSVSSVSDDGPTSSSGAESQLLGDTGEDDSAPEHGPQSHEDNGAGNDSSVSNETADAQAPADLPQGTEAPAQDGGSTSVTAAAIVMPSAEDLAGTSEGGHAQHNEVVGKVLADALHGGGGETSNIETLINSLPEQDGGQGNAALDALASHGAAAVPNGDISILAGFSAGHGMHMMEVHQDAAPAHA